MKFVQHHNNGLPTFKLIKHSFELSIFEGKKHKVPYANRGNSWHTIDENQSLSILLARYKMLDVTESELLAAQMLASKNALWQKSQSSRNYCFEQANLIARYADDAIERVASQIIEPCKFVDVEYGLPTWIRRLTLAFVLELGVAID